MTLTTTPALIAAVAEAITRADAEFEYSSELYRLVDGVSTRRLKIGGETFFYTDDDSNDWDAHAACSDHIKRVRDRARAEAVLAAIEAAQ